MQKQAMNHHKTSCANFRAARGDAHNCEGMRQHSWGHKPNMQVPHTSSALCAATQGQSANRLGEQTGRQNLEQGNHSSRSTAIQNAMVLAPRVVQPDLTATGQQTDSFCCKLQASSSTESSLCNAVNGRAGILACVSHHRMHRAVAACADVSCCGNTAEW